MAIDHYVRFRSEDDIALVSATRRRVADTTRPYFNIVSYLNCLIDQRKKAGDEFRLDIYSRDYPDPDSHASVTFHPLTLHSADDIWKSASNDDPFARFVLAHELGHISLHQYDELGYSGDQKRRISFAEKEHSAEWQADAFALHFLMPDDLVNKLQTADLLEAACIVPLHRARERIDMYRSKKKILNPKFNGACCTQCGNFSVHQTSSHTKCQHCGHTASI